MTLLTDLNLLWPVQIENNTKQTLEHRVTSWSKHPFNGLILRFSKSETDLDQPTNSKLNIILKLVFLDSNKQ